MGLSKGGRPRKVRNLPLLQQKIDCYFDSCHVRGKIPTVQGLAHHLGYADTSPFRYFAKQRQTHAGFYRTIAMAKMRIEAWKAQALVDGDLPPGRLRGLCFDLRVNHGWRDKISLKTHGGQEVGGVAVVGWDRWEEYDRNILDA